MSIAEYNDRDNDVTHDEEYWINYISAPLRTAVENIIETGRRLNEAKAELNHGEFTRMIESRLPFGSRAAEMLMAVAKNPVLANPNHGSHLPLSWRTLYELDKLPPKILEARLEDGRINPEMQRKDVAQLKPGFHPDPAAAHKAKMTPILRLKEEKEELERENADLEERLTAAEAAGGGVRVFYDGEDVEDIVDIIISVAGEDKAKEIAACIIKRFKRRLGTPAKA